MRTPPTVQLNPESGPMLFADCPFCLLPVPLDTATRPNAILVYDTVADAWQGIHSWPEGTAFDNLLITDWAGQKRLYGVDHSAARVHVLYEGLSDRIQDTENYITDGLSTRGYLLGENGIKNFRRVSVNVNTWNPRFRVRLTLDGQGEFVELSADPITKSRLAYYTHGTADWDPSNAADDHAHPKREDYSIDPATAIDPGASGIDPERKQTSLERRPCAVRARWASVRITNTRGACDISSVEIEAATAGRATKTQA